MKRKGEKLVGQWPRLTESQTIHTNTYNIKKNLVHARIRKRTGYHFSRTLKEKYQNVFATVFPIKK